MNKKSPEERAKILQLLVEGNSVRSTSRIADCSINTVMKLLDEIGCSCEMIQSEILTNLPCKFVQVDEIWSYVYARKKTKSDHKEAGEMWVFVSMCPETKLVISWQVGERTKETAIEFMEDLKPRLANKVQLSTDGFSAYKDAVKKVFGDDVHFGRLMKQYGEKVGNRVAGPYQGAHKEATIGSPDSSKIITAHIERQNLTMRMNIRRLARKTNAFSKKQFNHCSAISLHFMYYNFCRIHQTLKITPAMEAGITDYVWTLEEVCRMSDELGMADLLREYNATH